MTDQAATLMPLNKQKERDIAWPLYSSKNEEFPSFFLSFFHVIGRHEMLSG